MIKAKQEYMGGTGSVSYTHLDVYKRQHLLSAVLLGEAEVIDNPDGLEFFHAHLNGIGQRRLGVKRTVLGALGNGTDASAFFWTRHRQPSFHF